MLVRHMFGYAPSQVIVAILSFASLTLLTSLIDDHAVYGQYALAVTLMTGLIGVCFFWLQSAASRLLPQAVRQGTEAQLLATLYAAFAFCSVLLMALAGLLCAAMPLGDWRVAVIFAPPLTILRALLNLNQAAHRNFVQIMRYNIIEIGQAAIGLVAAAALVGLWHEKAQGAAAGLMIGLGAMAIFDWRMIARLRWRDFDWATFREIAQFGLPFIATYGLSFILTGSDRFLIEYFMGLGQVGIYSAGYAFPDRIGQNLFMMVATASFPLTVRRLEQEGVEAARDQTYTNGVAMLALAMPACAGMLLANRQIAHVLIGPSFSEGAAQVMPWIAVATILYGIAAHYFDHAFHLAKKTRLFFCTLGPAALLNFLGNLWAIPAFGILGAAYTTLAGCVLYLALSILIGRRVFKIKFPFRPALQIALSVLVMAGALSMFDFPETLAGLVAMVAIGGLVYGVCIYAFDIMGARSYVNRRLGKTRLRLSYKESGLDFAVLSEPEEIKAVALEWRQLHQRRSDLFGSPGWYDIWWRHLGESGGVTPHIVTARTGGRLAALLPLAVRRSGLLRILEWAGYEVFDYGDALAESAKAAQAAWRYISATGAYDIALIKDVREASESCAALAETMQLRERRRNYFLPLAFASGEAWLAAQSRKLRGDTRRKTEKMQARGAVAFHVHRDGEAVPEAVMEALYQQKAAWFAARGASGVFARPEIRGFLQELAQDAARHNMLYLAWLTCGEAVVACHMGFVREGVLHLYHTTYDADYGAFSPGNTMMIETVKWAIDAKLRELDFMRGDETYKRRFAGGTRALSAFVAGRSHLGRLAVALHALRGGKTDANEAAAAENPEKPEAD